MRHICISRRGFASGGLAAVAMGLHAAPTRDTRVYVDGATCHDLKALGKAAARPQGNATLFAASGKFANRWLTDASIGPGNFLVKVRLSIANPTFCDASIRIGGGDRELLVTLQGINGLFSIAGPLVRADFETGRVSKKQMRVLKDKVFELAIERVGDQLSVSCDGKLIRRQPSPRIEGYIHTAGLVLLLGLMAFVMFNDIRKLF